MGYVCSVCGVSVGAGWGFESPKQCKGKLAHAIPTDQFNAVKEEKVEPLVTSSEKKIGTMSLKKAAQDYATASLEEQKLQKKIQELNTKFTEAGQARSVAQNTLSTIRGAEPSGSIAVDLGDGQVLFYGAGMLRPVVSTLRTE